MKNQNVTTKAIIDKVYIGYLVAFALFYLFGSNRFPPLHLAFIQLFMLMLGYLLSRLMLGNMRYRVLSIFIFQTVSIAVLTLININYYQDPLGYDPHDALVYRGLGELYGAHSYSAYFRKLVVYLPILDDWGFPSIVWCLYHLFGKDGWIALLLLNAIAVAFGSDRLYKLSKCFVDEKYARLVLLFWGFMPFSICTATGGLKENFFAFIIISAFYYLYYYQTSKSTKNFVLLLVYTSLLFFFRLVTGMLMLLCIAMFFLMKMRFVRQNYIKLVFVGLFGAGMVLPAVFNSFAIYRNVSLESVSASADAKAEASGGASVIVANTISGIIGPFPNFISKDSDKINYITRYSFSPYVKVLISFFFVCALFVIVKKKDIELIPMAAFVLLHIVMIIFTFFALNMRFHWTHLPLFFLLSAYGYENRKLIPIFSKSTYIVYQFFSMLLVAYYNVR